MYPINAINFLILIVLFNQIIGPSEAVVVDGNKRKELSAVVQQKADEHLAIDPFNTKSCGMSNPNAEDHEFVNMAREGQFPWIVSFQIKILPDASVEEQKKAAREEKTTMAPSDKDKKQQRQRLDDLHFCSGSFISDKWILTAAHCFEGETIKNYYENNKLKVVAGSHKVSSRDHLNKNLTIERVYYHSKFNNKMPIGFDIALVELKNPVKFEEKREKDEYGEQTAPFMNTICLPLEGKKYSFNETARIAGWGLSSAKDISTMPSKLLTTDILMSDQDKCIKEYEKALKSEAPGRQKEQEDDFLCASYKDTRDACQSDSGGPLMQYVEKKAVAIGVVSYGIGCATKGVPGLYTRTSAYINWIKGITKDGLEAKVDFKVYNRASSGSKKIEEKTHQRSGTTTTKKPPQVSSRDPVTTPAPTIHESASSTKNPTPTATSTNSNPTSSSRASTMPPPPALELPDDEQSCVSSD